MFDGLHIASLSSHYLFTVDKVFYLICIFLNTVTIMITIQYYDLEDNSVSHNKNSSLEDDTNCS
jgi:hypothetical protein